MRYEAAREEVLRNHPGNVRAAAAELAKRMEIDDALRGQVATLVIAALFDPARTAHMVAFAKDTGRSPEAYVREFTPDPEDCRLHYDPAKR